METLSLSLVTTHSLFFDCFQIKQLMYTINMGTYLVLKIQFVYIWPEQLSEKLSKSLLPYNFIILRVKIIK